MKQQYKGIQITLIKRNYTNYAAMRFTMGNSNQNIWIPKKHLSFDGSLKPNENIDYVFRKAQRQLELAGYLEAIPGIKRQSVKVLERKQC
jgi:hypothetical protein